MAVMLGRSRRMFKDQFLRLTSEMMTQMLRNQLQIVTTTATDDMDVRKWCDTNIEGLYYHSDSIIYFELEEDMMAFKLYWSNPR